jgi:hypothetical protein
MEGQEDILKYLNLDPDHHEKIAALIPKVSRRTSCCGSKTIQDWVSPDLSESFDSAPAWGPDVLYDIR